MGRGHCCGLAQAELKRLGPILGSLGDLRRATSGEGETEPKQIGEGTQDRTGGERPPGLDILHGAICAVDSVTEDEAESFQYLEAEFEVPEHHLP